MTLSISHLEVRTNPLGHEQEPLSQPPMHIQKTLSLTFHHLP